MYGTCPDGLKEYMFTWRNQEIPLWIHQRVLERYFERIDIGFCVLYPCSKLQEGGKTILV